MLFKKGDLVLVNYTHEQLAGLILKVENVIGGAEGIDTVVFSPSIPIIQVTPEGVFKGKLDRVPANLLQLINPLKEEEKEEFLSDMTHASKLLDSFQAFKNSSDRLRKRLNKLYKNPPTAET